MTGILNLLAGAVGVVKDTYFNLVTLLLPGDGTNGAQNNTFLDSSTNNFTITRNGGNPGMTQGTFSPFSQTGWSNFFDGTGDYLESTLTGGINSTTFTLETWVYYTSLSSASPAYIFRITGGGSGTLLLGKNDPNYPARCLFIDDSGTTVFNLQAGTINANTWNHLAVVKDGANASLWLNGERIATTSSATSSPTFSGTSAFIGGYDSSLLSTGYISNLRIVSGSAVYSTSSTNITVPTAPLTAITNTKLLTCQSNRFIDASSNAYAITRTGDVSVQAFSPFAPTAAYSAATNGGSGYFDGTGDYLSVGATTDWTFMSNTTALFSIEAWIYNTTTGAQISLLGTNSGSSLNVGFYFFKTTSETLGFEITYGSSGNRVVNATSTSTLKANSWNHVLITYDQSLATQNLKFYINGGAAETTNKTANTPSNSAPSTALRIGTANASTEYYTGYLGSLRISNVIRSSGIPTSPYTSDANTKLLANFTNAGITDATAKNDLETVGGAQISTTQSKFGGSSMYFDGTGDYLIIPSSQSVALGSGDWTVEGWFYFANVTGIKTLFDQNATTRFYLYLNGTTLTYYTSGATQITGGTIAATTWYHIALVRSGGSTKLYLNGTQIGSSYADSQNYGAANFYIGSYFGAADYMNGYIDDLRITKGYARYTGNFTAPTAPFALQ